MILIVKSPGPIRCTSCEEAVRLAHSWLERALMPPRIRASDEAFQDAQIMSWLAWHEALHLPETAGLPILMDPSRGVLGPEATIRFLETGVWPEPEPEGWGPGETVGPTWLNAWDPSKGPRTPLCGR